MKAKENLKKKRILLSPVEIGGNMQLIVEELRRRGYDATSASGLYDFSDYLGYQNDIRINSYHARSRLQRHCSNLAFAIWASINYDVFHFFFGQSLYDNRFGRCLDLKLLRKLRKTIVVHFRGSDVIGPAYFEYLRNKAIGNNVSEPSISSSKQKRNIKIWQREAHCMLVSWPLLLEAVPDSIMVKQAIDLSCLCPTDTRPTSCDDGIIRIVHAPTDKYKKGTEYIEMAVNELKRMDYPIELILVEKMNSSMARRVYQSCDIGVDQLILGWYGNYSIELMSLGKPVICYINPKWRDLYQDLPVLSAGPNDLKEKLKMLIENQQFREDLGKRGIDYVKRHHDVKLIVNKCLDIYEKNL